MLDKINQLTESDLFSNELLTELYSIDDLVRFQITINEFKKRAKRYGCKSEFEKLLSAWETQHRRNAAVKTPTDNITRFSDSPVYKCGSYIADDSGVYLISRGETITVCPHPIYPVCILNNLDSSKCKIRLRFRLRNSWREIIVDQHITASQSAILELSDYGVQVTSSNSRHLCSFIM